MVSKIIPVLLVALPFLKAMSQNFGALPYLGNGLAPYYVERILCDPVHDELLLSSKWVNYAAAKKVRGIWSWNGIDWDSLKSGINTHDIINNQANGTILCGIPFNGKFLVGGIFESVGGVKATSLATWDGIKWDSLPVRAFKFLDYGASIYSFVNYNNKLYVAGVFDTIQGQKANGLAIYDGVSFQAVPVPMNSQAAITDMKVFNGDLYVSGVFTYTGQAGNRHILKFDGTNWSDVGGGIVGAGSSNIATMAVYNNELVVAGYFLKSAGNAGDLIMKWDGNTWRDVNWQNEQNNGGILKLIPHQNKLFAVGTFDLAGNNKASKIAVYDGAVWCTYADSLDGSILTADVYRDTLYVAGSFKRINADTNKKIVAKLLTPQNVNKCNMVGLSEYSRQTPFIFVFPNPVKDKLHLEFEQSPGIEKLTILNALGQEVYKLMKPSSKQVVDISYLCRGIYFVKAENEQGQGVFKVVKE